jgi:hypothetical protein
MKTPGCNLVFSYFPMLVCEPGTTFFGSEIEDNIPEMQNYFDSLPSGQADACLWCMDEDGSASIVLLMEDAKPIAEHLNYWSEEKPEEWFTLSIIESDSKYAVALAPNLDRSFERWKITFQLKTGFPPPVYEEEKYFFKPLFFVAKSKTSFLQSKNHIRNKSRVGLIDSKDFNQTSTSLDFSKIHWLGKFNTDKNPDPDSIVGQCLRNIAES